MFLIAPRTKQRERNSAVKLIEVADYPLIIASRPHSLRMSVESALARVDRQIRIAYEIECIPAAIDLVRQGHGFGVFPLNAVKSTQWSSQVLIKPIIDPVLKASLAIATSAHRPKTPLIRKATEVISEVVRRELR